MNLFKKIKIERNICYILSLLVIIIIIVVQYMKRYQNEELINEQTQQIFKLNKTLFELKKISFSLTLPQNIINNNENKQENKQNEIKNEVKNEIKIESSLTSSKLQSNTKNSHSIKAVLFTMDSIGSYEADSQRGGASGELLIRHSLERAFEDLGISLLVLRTDEQFASVNMDQFNIIIVDPWTWAGKGWNPKPMLIGQEKKVYVLDFFGSEKLLNSKPSFNIPPNRLLTAYGSPWNTFLGYYINETIFEKRSHETKLQQGVIWGKDPRHYERKEKLLESLSKKFKLHSTATSIVIKNSDIIWNGHQTPESWLNLLAKSKFLLGLGDPLLGPSAIDAISMGCMYINPVYKEPVRVIHKTQHDYVVNNIDKSYVCNVRLDNIYAVQECIKLALNSDLQPFIPHDFKYEVYLQRVREIFLDSM